LRRPSPFGTLPTSELIFTHQRRKSVSCKTKDPKLIELLDQVQKAHQSCERWYARLKRAFTAL